MIHLTKQTGGIMAAAMVTAMILGAALVFPAQADMQLAQASPPPAGATPAPPNTPPPATQADRIEAHIKKLHDDLQITPAQETQWAAVAQAMRDSASQLRTLAEARAKNAGTKSALDDLKSYQAIAQAHLDGVNKLVPAFGTLYAAMPDAQKKVARLGFQLEKIRLHLALGSQSAGDHAAEVGAQRLFAGHVAQPHLLIHKGVVLGELLQFAIAHPVAAAVADIEHQDAAFLNQQAHQRGAHAVEILVVLGPG